MHVRQAIRQAIAAALTTALDPVPVSTMRTRPIQEDEQVIALVYAMDEASERITVGGTRERRLRVVVDIRARANEGLDDELDALCVLAEQALDADPTFGRLALDSDLTGTEIGLVGEGDETMGSARLTYSVKYRARPGQPEAA